jgi:hypothetical protein
MSPYHRELWQESVDVKKKASQPHRFRGSIVVALTEPHWSSQFSTVMPMKLYQFHLSPMDNQNFGHAAGLGGLAPFGKGIHHF